MCSFIYGMRVVLWKVIFGLCPVSCTLFSPSEVGAPDCGQCLLGQIRGYFWSIGPRRRGVNLELSLCLELSLLGCEIKG